MRVFPPLSVKRYHARAKPKEPVPLKTIIPISLKEKVSGKGSKLSDVCCLHEMSVLFSCFTAHDFQQAPCSKEIQSFQKCYQVYTTEKAQKFDREMKGLLTPGEKNLTSKQLNILLKRYPKV
ncbi:small ribosomal subunit protein mS37 [Euwallacea fornicatus]|uniref:small ribosomal subunit protein mS37 n=1 Tax=Euwallacea fornicatus TaxID=995702 RepID=UPI00338F3175